MSTDPSWLIATFTPGLSPIRYRCVAEITLSGHLCQRLSERSGGEWFPITAKYETRLDTHQFEMLHEAVASVDFERLTARLTPARDASRLAIEWYPPDAPSKRVEGRILSYDRGYHDFRQTFEPAQRLWKLVYDFLPHKFIECA